MGFKERLSSTPFLLLLSSLLLLPAILSSPQYSSGGYGSYGVDQDTIDDIFGDTVRGGYGVDDDDEWVTVPVNLIPEDDGCEPMKGPRSEPQMMSMHEEHKKIEVVRAVGNKKCDFYTETRGFECVPYYQCDDDGTIITDGAGLIDIRFGGEGPELAVLDSTDLMCPGSLDVCCKSLDFTAELTEQQSQAEELIEPRTTTSTTTTTTTTTTAAPVQQEQQAEQQEELVETTTLSTTTTTADYVVVEPEPYTYTPRCGKRNHNGLGARIMGFQDDEAQFGEWPHICAVLKREVVTKQTEGYSQQQQEEEEEILVFQAGASLIAPGVVLTAAHKVAEFEGNPGDLVVRCGEWDTQTTGEPLDHQDRTVNHIVSHAEFNPRNLGNTIALLFVENDFELADHIDTICLPAYQENFELSKGCYVKGWGKDVFGKEGEYQVVLKEVSLPMVSDAQCLDWLRATRLGRRFRLDQSFVCAGGEEGKDACRGDGGGPLVCPKRDDPSRFVQVGIVAWGIGCGQAEVPGVYTAVAEQACWIDWAMRCRLGSAYTLQQGSECQAWLENKQRHRVPAIRNVYTQCEVTWPAPEPYTTQQEQQQQVEELDLSSYGRKTKGESTLPERIISKTKAPRQQQEEPTGSPKTEGYGK